MKFHHVGITVKSIKQSVAWYTTQFNCKTDYMDDTWAMLQFPKGGYLALVTDTQHPPHFCLETPDAGIVIAIRILKNVCNVVWL